jgi:hypothetical protein
MMDFPNSCRKLEVGKDITIAWKIALVMNTFFFFFSLFLFFFNPHIIDAIGCQVKSSSSKHKASPSPFSGGGANSV